MRFKSRSHIRQQRKKRIKDQTRGTPERPRLTVFRSSRHIYAQIIDDVSFQTLVEASSLSKGLKTQCKGYGGNVKSAQLIGESIAKLANEKGIKKVVFDRNGFLYHGRIKAVAESARENGLEF
ncbi:MAG: 50S ribosomal protein L18 [Deltaproteobacteria bacterium]|nr:50S ribosomal protein L18 [Deltaproteobacteria bacterium]